MRSRSSVEVSRYGRFGLRIMHKSSDGSQTDFTTQLVSQNSLPLFRSVWNVLGTESFLMILAL